QHQGAPWCCPAWQERTNVRHGLFPTADRYLPEGWTREQAVHIEAYLIAFGSGDNASTLPGGSLLDTWIRSNWPHWGVHPAIVEAFQEAEIHPHTLSRRLGLETLDDGSWGQHLNSEMYLPIAFDQVAARLFGEDFLEENISFLPQGPIRR